MRGKREPKRQVVLVVKLHGRKQSFTRHVVDGKIRALDCPHGVSCKKDFRLLAEEAARYDRG